VKQLTTLFPPHQVYVEPFFGGGAVFFGKTPSEKEIVNDLDSKLIQDYKRILQAPSSVESYKIPKTLLTQNRFLTETHTSIPDKVIESLLRRCNGFGGRYIETTGVTQASDERIQKVTLHKSKLQRMEDYKKRLNDATILNQDYRKVIKKYDSGKTFFFLDPPYEMSKGINYAKGSETFDFEELAKTLRDIKGDFLMTINDSPRIREVFREFKIYPYVVKGHHSETSPIGSKDRKELLVSNYTLPKMSGGTKDSDKLKKIDDKLKKINDLIIQHQNFMNDLLSGTTGMNEADTNEYIEKTETALAKYYKDEETLNQKKMLIERGSPASSVSSVPIRLGVTDSKLRKAIEEYRNRMRQVHNRINQDEFLKGPLTEVEDEGSGKPRPKGYLAEAKRKAKEAGYDPSKLSLCKDGVHKLAYKTPEGEIVRFGSAEHGDHIIWSNLEKQGKVPSGTADTKRRVFRKSHQAMKGLWRNNPTSPNNLALAILW
jgi:DNA adenine methylase